MIRRVCIFSVVFAILIAISSAAWGSLVVGSGYYVFYAGFYDYFFPQDCLDPGYYVVVENLDFDAAGPYEPFQLKSGWSFAILRVIWIASFIASVGGGVFAVRRLWESAKPAQQDVDANPLPSIVGNHSHKF